MWWALSAHLVEIGLTALTKTGWGALFPTRFLRPYMCNVHASLGVIPGLVVSTLSLFNQALQTHDFYTVVSKQCHKMDVLEAALMETLNTPTLSLKLENPYRTFRTAREIEKDGHGNYISGIIEFNPAPKSDEVIVNTYFNKMNIVLEIVLNLICLDRITYFPNYGFLAD